MILDLIAGGIAGAVSRTGVAPLDLMKIQRQASYLPNTTIRDVIKKEGVRYLWKGNGINCVRIGPQIAINYAIFETSKKYIDTGNKTVNNLICGSFGGCISMASIYPLETIRSRFALQTNKSHYDGVFKAMKKMKFREFYRGLGISLIGITPYTAINFAVYHNLKDKLKENGVNTSLSQVLAGGLSAQVAISVTYPTDFIRRQFHVQGFDPSVPKYTGILDCIRKVVKTNGVRGLYRGLGACYISIFPKGALQFWSFEISQKLLKNVFE